MKTYKEKVRLFIDNSTNKGVRRLMNGVYSYCEWYEEFRGGNIKFEKAWTAIMPIRLEAFNEDFYYSCVLGNMDSPVVSEVVSVTKSYWKNYRKRYGL